MQALQHVWVTQMDQQVQAQAPVQVQVVEEAQVTQRTNKYKQFQMRDMSTGYVMAILGMDGTKSNEHKKQHIGYYLGLAAIFLPAAIKITISVPLVTYAVSQYDSDGFTVFPTNSSDYMSSYRAGVIKADKNTQLFYANKLPGIDTDYGQMNSYKR